MMTPVLMDELGKKLPIFFKLFFLLKLEIHNFFNVRGEMSDLFSILGMIFLGEKHLLMGDMSPQRHITWSHTQGLCAKMSTCSI